MPRLEVRDIVMQFPAVRALKGVSLSFEPGTVHGIIGENGAGKSTLMRILAGLQQPTEGQVFLDGNPVLLHGVRDALSRGIAMIHQELNLVDTLSAADNVFLGRELSALGKLDRKGMIAHTRRYLDAVGATFPADALVGSLSLAQKQLVEIAKALSCDASILIMDEPTAVLSENEVNRLFALIADLKSKGATILYISHLLPEVERICDRVSVLRDGELVGTLDRESVTQETLARMMVGRDLGDVFPVRTPPQGEGAALEVVGLGDENLLRDISFAVRPGEIVGLAGLMGSGRTEIGECLVGLRKRVSGKVLLEGRERRLASPKAAAKAGMAYVSEDRKDAGLILSLNVVENTTLPNLTEYAKPFLNKKAEARSTEKWIGSLGIRVGDARAPILLLSGGNQQKVCLAKWLEVEPSVLILDEPTRGVDVGAKREIYQMIHDLAASGKACVFISSELPELIGLCHRILVLRSGRIVGELAGETATEEQIMVLAAGVEAA